MANKTPNTAPNAPVEVAFYQPDIPQNVGAAMRLCACLDVPMHVIEPTAFLWKDDAFRRSGMDYRDHVTLTRHQSWDAFDQAMTDRRIILLTTKSDAPYLDFSFEAGDVLLMGSESYGVPEAVHQGVPHTLTIPMKTGFRSLNVVNAAALVMGEALRQTGGLPR